MALFADLTIQIEATIQLSHNRSSILSTEIFELSEQEILAIAGASQIDPPAAALTSATEGIEVPQIENNPPG